MTDGVRAFVAVDLEPPSPIPDALARWPSHFHATLRFFAEIDAPTGDRVVEAVRRTCAHRPPFSIELRGIGAFPNPQDARVVWMGFGEGREHLIRTASELDENLEREGVPRDPRPFAAHATLFRVRGPRDRALAQRALSLGDRLSFGARSVGSLAIYESRLGGQGADHRLIERVGLTGSS